MEPDEPVFKKITKYGYEYTLVLCTGDIGKTRKSKGLREPCFMKQQGYALQSFRKIKQSKIAK